MLSVSCFCSARCPLERDRDGETRPPPGCGDLGLDRSGASALRHGACHWSARYQTRSPTSTLFSVTTIISYKHPILAHAAPRVFAQPYPPFISHQKPLLVTTTARTDPNAQPPWPTSKTKQDPSCPRPSPLPPSFPAFPKLTSRQFLLNSSPTTPHAA